MLLLRTTLEQMSCESSSGLSELLLELNSVPECLLRHLHVLPTFVLGTSSPPEHSHTPREVTTTTTLFGVVGVVMLLLVLFRRVWEVLTLCRVQARVWVAHFCLSTCGSTCSLRESLLMLKSLVNTPCTECPHTCATHLGIDTYVRSVIAFLCYYLL
jgi:hypothetical protein